MGEGTARTLAQSYFSLAELRKATEKSLRSITGIGQVTATSVVRFFNDEINNEIVDSLFYNGVILDAVTTNTDSPGILSGKTLCITGTFKDITRSELKIMIEKAGGQVSTSLSVYTDILVCGNNPGTKHFKALDLNIKVVYEKDLNKLFDLSENTH